jgi:hypothetical protein
MSTSPTAEQGGRPSRRLQATITLWIPAWDAYCWASPESLTVCGTLSEARLPSRL